MSNNFAYIFVSQNWIKLFFWIFCWILFLFIREN